MGHQSQEKWTLGIVLPNCKPGSSPFTFEADAEPEIRQKIKKKGSCCLCHPFISICVTHPEGQQITPMMDPLSCSGQDNHLGHAHGGTSSPCPIWVFGYIINTGTIQHCPISTLSHFNTGQLHSAWKFTSNNVNMRVKIHF